MTSSASILVVEDDSAMRELLASTLQGEGYHVESAEDGKSGLETALRTMPDLILSDLLMPTMNGIELCYHVRNENTLRNVIFILLSAKADLRHKLIGFDSGADDFLPKPFETEELLARIQAGLRLKNIQDSLRNRNKELADLLSQFQTVQSQLIHSEKMAAIGVLAGGIAHEFNNIMGGVIGYCEMAVQDTDPEFMKKTLAITLKALQRACAITQNMLEFARHTEGKFEEADIFEVLQDTLQLVHLDLEKSGIDLEVEHSALPLVTIDIGQVQQVFLNLIVNARDALEGRQDARLTIHMGRDEKYATIHFRDNGVGIRSEDLKHVFDPFFTKKTAINRKHTQGTGLGLSVSHTIIQDHGGAIEVESEVGKGTTFSVRLPLVREASGMC